MSGNARVATGVLEAEARNQMASLFRRIRLISDDLCLGPWRVHTVQIGEW